MSLFQYIDMDLSCECHNRFNYNCSFNTDRQRFLKTGARTNFIPERENRERRKYPSTAHDVEWRGLHNVIFKMNWERSVS